MPSEHQARLAFGILLFGLGISLLTTGGVGLFALRLVKRAIGGEPIVLLVTIVGGLLLALGSALTARSFN